MSNTVLKTTFFTKIFYVLKKDGYILQKSLKVLESFKVITQSFIVQCSRISHSSPR